MVRVHLLFVGVLLVAVSVAAVDPGHIEAVVVDYKGDIFPQKPLVREHQGQGLADALRVQEVEAPPAASPQMTEVAAANSPSPALADMKVAAPSTASPQMTELAAAHSPSPVLADMKVGPCRASLDKFENRSNGYYIEKNGPGHGDDACKVEKGTEISLEECASFCEASYPCGGFALFPNKKCWIFTKRLCDLDSVEGPCTWVSDNDADYHAKKVDEGGDSPASKAQVAQLEEQIAQTDTELNKFANETTETLTKLEGVEEHTSWILNKVNDSKAHGTALAEETGETPESLAAAGEEGTPKVPVEHKKPTTAHKTVAVEHEKGPVEHKKPATAHKTVAVGQKKVPVEHKKPTTAHKTVAVDRSKV